ncbi:MAG: alpha-L-rhamnosidase, partial [Candidatus Aminicenantes bacterium]|nr:alpha-L-rhamnosidase [Candidatus Aminicenantes bacterium]
MRSYSGRGIFFLVMTALMSIAVLASAEDQAGPQPPSGLRCEYLVDPLGVDIAAPRLSWILEHSERGQGQTSYEILVSSQPGVEEGDIWASGKVDSAESFHIVYSGKPLLSGRSYYWKVRYWDRNGRPSPFSQVARFDTGLFSPADWRGRWISGENQLRREFDLGKKPVRARAHVCGLGYS